MHPLEHASVDSNIPIVTIYDTRKLISLHGECLAAAVSREDTAQKIDKELKAFLHSLPMHTLLTIPKIIQHLNFQQYLFETVRNTILENIQKTTAVLSKRMGDKYSRSWVFSLRFSGQRLG